MPVALLIVRGIKIGKKIGSKAADTMEDKMVPVEPGTAQYDARMQQRDARKKDKKHGDNKIAGIVGRVLTTGFVAAKNGSKKGKGSNAGSGCGGEGDAGRIDSASTTTSSGRSSADAIPGPSGGRYTIESEREACRSHSGDSYSHNNGSYNGGYNGGGMPHPHHGYSGHMAAAPVGRNDYNSSYNNSSNVGTYSNNYYQGYPAAAAPEASGHSWPMSQRDQQRQQRAARRNGGGQY